MKRYKPKKWFIYTRLLFVFMIIFTMSTTTNVVYEELKATNNNDDKTLDHEVMEDNKENIYYAETDVISKYLNLPEKGFVVTNNNQKYTLNDEDYRLLVAVVASESNRHKDDILAVMSVILNRCDASGKTPIEVVTAKGQFSGYLDGHYKRYFEVDGTLKGSTNMAQEVVTDALNGIRNNHYYSFRSWGTSGYSENYIKEYGNRYR